MDDEVDSAVATALGDPNPDLGKLIKDDEAQDFSPGAIIKGRVSSVAGDDFVVELGLKSEGSLERGEFDEPDASRSAPRSACSWRTSRATPGLVKISKRKADRIINWEAIMKSKKEGDPVSGKVTKKIKGGLLVDIGVPGLPPRQPGRHPPPGRDQRLDRPHIDAMILKIDEERRNIVISRRKMIEVQREELKRKTLDTIVVGTLVTGTVKNIADFGAFIDLGGIDGLLHITDMSWGRINHPSEMLKIDQRSRSRSCRSTRTRRRSRWA
jgi:small subunit ribosomal protein S1